MLNNWRRERFIRRTLRRLARQRVGLILQPGDVWVIENALTHERHTDAALSTSHLRGWVEPIQHAVPHASLNPDGSLPEDLSLERVGPIYRLTEAGWNAINRIHQWVIVTCSIAGLTLLLTAVNLTPGPVAQLPEPTFFGRIDGAKLPSLGGLSQLLGLSMSLIGTVLVACSFRRW